jgi:hypothetical protein
MGKQYTLFDESSPAAGAEFSECGRYRYKLWRKWDENKPIAMCIGLNPSTANFSKDAPTIGTLKRILTNLGYGGFYMMNLFALISSKPSALLKCEDPIGDNDTKLKEVEKLCDDVIVCWGDFKQAKDRITKVLPNYPNAKCFGTNKNGTPCHPLALMYSSTVKSPQLIDYKIIQE